MSPRPKGRRNITRKATLFSSELEKVLEHCPEGDTEIARVSLLCREIAQGKWSVVEKEEFSTEDPPELREARARRKSDQLGRTQARRVQRDVLFFAKEWVRFQRRLPGQLTLAEFLRGLAAGRFSLVKDGRGSKTVDFRQERGLCVLCALPKTDRGEYCLSCRTAKSQAA